MLVQNKREYLEYYGSICRKRKLKRFITREFRTKTIEEYFLTFTWNDEFDIEAFTFCFIAFSVFWEKAARIVSLGARLEHKKLLEPILELISSSYVSRLFKNTLLVRTSHYTSSSRRKQVMGVYILPSFTSWPSPT